MTRRARIDGAKGMQEVVSQSDVVLPVPACAELNENAKPFWATIVQCKATRGWTEADLVMLVNLCNTLADIKYWRSELQNVNHIVGEDGKERPHPYIGMIDTAEKRARMYNSHLQLHPQATQGPPKKQAEQNKLHNQSRGGELDDDPLLASPH